MGNKSRKKRRGEFVMFESWKEREFEKKMERFRTALQEKNTILIGAGAGLSTSAGFTYSGERFRKYFADFEQKYGFHDNTGIHNSNLLCDILAASTLTIRWKNTGRTGADTFTSTVIRTRQNRFTRNCSA